MNRDKLERSVEELKQVRNDGYADVQCRDSGEYLRVEPDARELDCPVCDAQGTITSSRVVEGLI